MIMETKTEKLIEALKRLAESIDSMDGVANAVIFEAAQRLDELQTALQNAHASLVLARNERDEAHAEVEERKKALIDASYQIDNYKSKFLLWFENAKTQNTKLLDALEDLTKARAEMDAIRNVISNAGFSDVLDPLQRVTRLIQERDEAISERTPHDYGLLASQRDDYRDKLCASIKETQEARAEVKRLEIINKEVLEANYTMGTTRPKPSRLEIAAIILTGSYGNAGSYQDLAKIGLKQADALIAAEKEAQ